MTIIYGIKNCDTIKKALKWLTENEIEFLFHDYRKDGVQQDIIKQWINEFGWDQVINKRGTTWRSLDEQVKENMSNEQALSCIMENPAIIKRPFLVHNGATIIGFSVANYESFFTK